MITTSLRTLQQILVKVAELSGTTKVKCVSTKALQDYVTNVDTTLDIALTSDLRAAFPGIPVLSEERLVSDNWPQGEYWLIDPLDGTHNLIAGVPFTAISVALCKGTKPILAGVFDLGTGRTYVASLGDGAYVGGTRFQTPSSRTKLLGVSSGLTDRLVANPSTYAGLRKLGKLRNFGAQSLHLVYVAEGKLDATLSQEARFWDDAAGRLIAQEAGATYHSFATSTAADAHMRSLCAQSDVATTLCPLMEKLWSKV